MTESGIHAEDQLTRLAELMATLRVQCPWDAEQTHLSLVNFLIEETAEVVDAIETGNDCDLLEELGDLLLQVFFHAEIARQEGRFDIQQVAKGVSDKLVSRHAHIFMKAEKPNSAEDMWQQWELTKKKEKNRKSSLEGIPDSLNVLAKIYKIILRARTLQLQVDLPTEKISADELGDQLVTLLSRAQASGIDPDQAARVACRNLEKNIKKIEV